jgi:hypothetical protein
VIDVARESKIVPVDEKMHRSATRIERDGTNKHSKMEHRESLVTKNHII